MKYSVIKDESPAALVYYLVPLELEAQFADIDCDHAARTIAPLDELLQILNEFEGGNNELRKDFTSEHYQFLYHFPEKEPGMEVKVLVR
jgi:hypothetical protein